MKNIVVLLLLMLSVPISAQYSWEEVALPDSIGAGSICFYGDDTYLATGNGVYHSSDNCESWEYIGLGQYPIWSIHVSTTGNLFAGTNSRIYRYAGNIQWDLLYTTADATNILSIYESENGHIFFGNWGGIFRSTDGGSSWTEVLDLFNTEVVNTIAENADGVLFAGSTSFQGDVSPGGIYRSVNNGTTWQLTGLEHHFVSSIVINSSNEVFAGTNGHWTTGTGRIYKSADDGQNWDIVFDNHYILSLSINGYNEIASASETGIFCTYDDGLYWENITPSWTGDYFEEVAFHPQKQLYAISYFVYSDLYRTLEPVFIDNKYSVNYPKEVQLYPNPTDHKIFLVNENAQFDDLLITDITGRIIRSNIPQNKSVIEIKIDDLQPSVYLIHCFRDDKVYTLKFIKY